MRVCLIIDDYLPDSIKIGAKMMHDLGQEFKSRGHEVMVITPGVELTKPKEISEIDGITVCRFKCGKIKNTSLIRRAINETLLSLRAWYYLRIYLVNNPCQLIIYYSPSIFWGQLVKKLKHQWKAKSYLVLRDFFPQWVIDNGMLSNSSVVTKYFRFFEKINYSAADVIGLQSPKNIDVFKAMTNTNKQLAVLYNWASKSTVPEQGDYKSRLQLNEKIVFFYGGNIGHAQDMMNIVKLAKAMKNESLAHFLLVGEGDEVDLIHDAIELDELNNMTLLPAVSQQEYIAMLASFDIGLFCLHRDHSAHNFPGKLLGYMSAHKPILGCVNPGNDLRSIIENAGAGFITETGNHAELYANAFNLLFDEGLRNRMGTCGRQLLESTFSVSVACSSITGSLNLCSASC